MANDDYAEYEDQILDVDEIEGTDVKINPDYYIHNGVLKAQQALINPNFREGLAQYRLLVEHVEVLCRAASMLTDDYQKSLNEFKTSDEYKNELDLLVKSALLANKKLELLMSQVFANKVSTMPLTMKKAKAS